MKRKKASKGKKCLWNISGIDGSSCDLEGKGAVLKKRGGGIWVEWAQATLQPSLSLQEDFPVPQILIIKSLWTSGSFLLTPPPLFDFWEVFCLDVNCRVAAGKSSTFNKALCQIWTSKSSAVWRVWKDLQMGGSPVLVTVLDEISSVVLMLSRTTSPMFGAKTVQWK